MHLKSTNACMHIHTPTVRCAHAFIEVLLCASRREIVNKQNTANDIEICQDLNPLVINVPIKPLYMC